MTTEKMFTLELSRKYKKLIQVTSYANSQVGIAIMYINGNTIIMEKPSETTIVEMEKTARRKLDVSSTEKIVLNRIKETVDKNDIKKGKRKKPQAPNPLR